MSGPLAGIRIIEMAGVGPGPFCGMMLADHGAEIIRLYRPGAQGIAQNTAKDFLNRSRKNIAVDLKKPDGVDVVKALCQSADGLFEGFRPGVMERLGLGPEPLLAENPKLVYGRMTGFGQYGPYASMAGHDINYIALSGALHACGRAGQKPTPPLNLVGDFGGGGMMLAFGMLAAIISARTTGMGQVIDCAMTEGSAVLMSMVHSLRADNLWSDDRGVNLLDGGAPFYDSFETADGKFVAIGPVESHFYQEMIALIGLGDDADMQVQHDTARWHDQTAKIAAAILTKTRDEWCTIMEGKDACFAPVMSLDEAPRHRHNIARKAFVDVGGALQPAPAPRYSRTVTGDPRPPLGGREMTTALLKNAGLNESKIERLFQDGIVA